MRTASDISSVAPRDVGSIRIDACIKCEDEQKKKNLAYLLFLALRHRVRPSLLHPIDLFRPRLVYFQYYRL